MAVCSTCRGARGERMSVPATDAASQVLRRPSVRKTTLCPFRVRRMSALPFRGHRIPSKRPTRAGDFEARRRPGPARGRAISGEAEAWHAPTAGRHQKPSRPKPLAGRRERRTAADRRDGITTRHLVTSSARPISHRSRCRSNQGSQPRSGKQLRAYRRVWHRRLRSRARGGAVAMRRKRRVARAAMGAPGAPPPGTIFCPYS